MGKYLETHSLPKLTYEEIGKLKPITNQEIESLIKKRPTRKIQMASQVNSTKHLRS